MCYTTSPCLSLPSLILLYLIVSLLTWLNLPFIALPSLSLPHHPLWWYLSFSTYTSPIFTLSYSNIIYTTFAHFTLPCLALSIYNALYCTWPYLMYSIFLTVYVLTLANFGFLLDILLNITFRVTFIFSIENTLLLSQFVSNLFRILRQFYNFCFSIFSKVCNFQVFILATINVQLWTFPILCPKSCV